MKFVVHEHDGFDEIIQLEPHWASIAYFYDKVGMAHDYCDFLNDKYCDKEVNAEWGEIDRLKRIKYHLKELEKLINDNELHWNEHGNEVEE